MKVPGLSAIAVAGTLVNAAKGPFLEQINDSTWVIGNDHWNLTQGALYATKLFWEGVPGADLVGSAVGHYVGYDGENNFRFTNATVASRGTDYIDVSFSAAAGDFHWVIFDDLTGAYQYFVNRALPDISILRTLWRLAPDLFPNGRTHLKDEPLPDFSLYASATNVQDETWQLADGSFITKYDWSNAVRDRDFYGVYGPKAGSWYIHPSTEYYNSDHLSQTLTVHRESKTGDAVQLNVVQDTSHFRVGQKVAQPEGKVWGPWLWYLNNGDVADAARKRKEEDKHVPYTWFKDAAYHSRGGVQGTLTLSDGRPASGAAVFLGDADTTVRPSIQGRNYYYTTYANDKGRFSFDGVRSGSYAVYATSNGGKLGDVYTNFTAPVTVAKDKTLNLGQLTWGVPPKGKRVFQVGEFDKKASGFRNGGVPYQHGVAAQSPANLTFTVGESRDSDWYFAQSALGKWTIEFGLAASDVAANRTALLSVSLAGYSQSGALDVDVNGHVYGSLNKDGLTSDPALYRSGKVSGEWRFLQYRIDADVLRAGVNTVGFTVTRYTQWRGFLWDSIILEWI
ncbi:Putative Galactose-binding-like domain superfamily, galactose mutarotase-like domain superfamily [Colletotrichum destructivum]|uniref:rhamnogalacturonan endolyase n=1 Tax=Colletotrichum destructivum TaxID=34406 RepID=A0AAX4ISY7_9PEZI|nr:Putative Galactose-binding-like domain superfamily, galactose mutarotase-like domain superfamily [Colletotrichum destructivum]